MALHEHFGHAGDDAEISVDLETQGASALARVRAEQIPEQEF